MSNSLHTPETGLSIPTMSGYDARQGVAMECPHCGKELSVEEVKSLWAAYTGSIKTEAKARSSAENGKKGGRPRKPKGVNDDTSGS